MTWTGCDRKWRNDWMLPCSTNISLSPFTKGVPEYKLNAASVPGHKNFGRWFLKTVEDDFTHNSKCYVRRVTGSDSYELM